MMVESSSSALMKTQDSPRLALKMRKSYRNKSAIKLLRWNPLFVP